MFALILSNVLFVCITPTAVMMSNLRSFKQSAVNSTKNMLKFSVVKEGAHPNGKYEENTVEAAFDSTAAAVGTAPHLIEPTAAVQRKPSHPHGTSFILTPTFYTNTSCDQSCPISKNTTWTMVTFIKSTANNYLRREFIRKTWGSVKYTESGRFFFVFVVGRPDSDNTLSLVEEESARYEDILMYNGSDGYRNIARKTLAGMQWTSENLPPEYYYSTADDDFLIDMAIFEDIVNQNLALQKRHSWPIFPFVCTYRVLPFPHVVRDSNYKSFVPVEEYPWPDWPRGCLGGFYTSKADVISRLWLFTKDEVIVRMDDVWITGVLRMKMGIPDYAVVQPFQYAATHYSGFRDKGDLRDKDFMKEPWAAATKKLFQRPHCVCIV